MKEEIPLSCVTLPKADLLVGGALVAKKTASLSLVDLAGLPRAVFDPRLLTRKNGDVRKDKVPHGVSQAGGPDGTGSSDF